MECSSSFWYSYPFGLRALILNGSNNRKYVLGENWFCSSKRMAPVLGNRAVPFLRKSARLTLGKWHGLCRTSATDLGKNCHRLRENQQPTLGKSATVFGKIGNRLWENQPPTLGKSDTDFGKMPRNATDFAENPPSDFGKISHRLWENRPPTLEKLATDFGKINHRLWENRPPTLGKSATNFGKIGNRLWENLPPTLRKFVTRFGVTGFGEKLARFWGNTGSVLGKNWLDLGGNCFGF